jgi:hypothetical protein
LQVSLPPQVLLVLVGQSEPSQHGWLLPPHTSQVLPAVLQANGDEQTPPRQHAWPAPPQGRHCPFTLTVSGAVQLIPFMHEGWPSLPQAPLLQPPPVQAELSPHIVVVQRPVPPPIE